jgi:hypothetical protein
MAYPEWMPVWPLYQPITFSLVATVAAVTIDSDARANGRPDTRRRGLMVVAVALLALVFLPFGIGSTTHCRSDTGGSLAWGPLWWLGPAALLPVVTVLTQVFRAAGAPGRRPWNLATLVAVLAIGAFPVEVFLSVMSLFALCDPGSATLLVIHLAVAALIPIGGAVVAVRRRSTPG